MTILQFVCGREVHVGNDLAEIQSIEAGDILNRQHIQDNSVTRRKMYRE